MNPTSLRDLLVMLIAAGSLLLLFAPSLQQAMVATLDPTTLGDDARQQIPPIYLDNDLARFSRAIDVTYYKDMLPIGYKWLYRMALHFLDVVTFSKWLTWILFGIFLYFIALCSYRLGGVWAAWATLAFILSSGIHLSAMAGGLPRSFAPPAIAALAWMLTTDRVFLMALLTIATAAFYPVASVICGFSFATRLLLLPIFDKTVAPHPAAWSLRKKFALLAMTAMATLLFMLPQFFSAEAGRHGSLLTIEDCATFPEIGPEGRYGGDGICTPRDSLPRALVSLSAHGISDFRQGQPWSETLRRLGHFKLMIWNFSRDEVVIGMLWLTILAAAHLLLARPKIRRLSIIIVAGAFCFLLAQVYLPYLYLPQRYLEHTASIFLVIVLPVAASTLALACQRRFFQGNHNPAMVGFLAILLLVTTSLLFLGGKGNATAGFSLTTRHQSALIDFISRLPEDSLIAGWPRGPTNHLSLTAKQSVFLAKETHQAFHRDITLTMRQRMFDLIDAFHATTPEPLLRLRDRHGVTHLIFDRNVSTQNKPMKYFAPFQTHIASRFAQSGNRAGVELERQIPFAEIFRDATHSVLDLTRIHDK
ncbi:MAG: hypothetical protein HQM03_19160 [Magnetococcales bacterium]|nr:hypothetical protein [Magnetococcales bacterium]